MRYRLLVAVLIAASAAALAIPPELGNTAPPKVAQSWPVNVPVGRQVGDTIESPFVIPSVPYATSGTTAGFANDYDEICPYSGSTAADVVYRFVPTESLALNIDLCGSAFDTKLYVYDGDGSVLGCNDDNYFGAPCGLYVSMIENVVVQPGNTYFIVIDGYGIAFGEYDLSIVIYEPCVLEWTYSDIEGEPPLHDGYVDNFNGGCNSPNEVFGDYNAPFTYTYDCLSGTSGWFQSSGNWTRDSDWYWFYGVVSGHVTFTLDAEHPTNLFWVTMPGNECYNVCIVQSALAGPCAPASITVEVAPGGSCLMVVNPNATAPPTWFVGHEYAWQLRWTVGGSFMPVPLLLREYERLDNRITDGWSFVGQHIGTLSNDISSDQSCDGPATPGPDGLLAVYLESGEVLEIDNWVIYYPAIADRALITYTLLTDLRGVPGACVGLHETSTTYLHTFQFIAEQTGWHYLVVDSEVAGTKGVSTDLCKRPPFI
jgi:hypothetical protein